MTTPLIAQASISHYLGKGISKDVSVGILACLYYESKLNPGSQGNQSTETPGVLNPGGAFGVASWNGPRQVALANYAKDKGLDPAALTTQLDFVLTECANSYKTVWAAIQDPTMTYQKFIPIFVDDYEIPADKPKEIAAALAYADAWYPAVEDPTTPVISPPVSPPVAAPNLTPDQSAVVDALAAAILDATTIAVVKALANAILKELS